MGIRIQRMKSIKKWVWILILSLLVSAPGCSGDSSKKAEETKIQVFIAASLNTVMTDLSKMYEKEHPNVRIVCNADSSGTLLNQIEEGYACDIFFSAAQEQMDQLEEGGLLKAGTRADVVNNQLAVVTGKDSKTSVQGLNTLERAESIALAGESVPAGRYTRQALITLGILREAEKEAAEITTQEVSKALNNVEISEQDNVSKVLFAVAEGSCEVGTVYYSDIYGYENRLDIIEAVSHDLTGDVRYPAARVINKEADKAQNDAADDFLKYILSEEAKEVFESYYFDTDVE